MKSRVAIACQGGGSHTAFTAGVLRALLTSPKFGRDFEITALSGTSGGALCAGIIWSRLLAADGHPGEREAKAAAEALRNFWLDLSCDNEIFTAPWRGGPFDYMDALSNAVMTNAMRLNPFAEQDCNLVSRITRRRMLTLLERHIPLELLKEGALGQPKLRVAATNILEGYTEPIAVEQYGKRDLHRILLASASIPPLFPATVLHGAYFWDGLYSHNPPIDCLTNLKPLPDEIWVIQINPDSRSAPPRNAPELVDRRNELMGNLSLAAELYHIDAMNWLIDKSPKALNTAGFQKIKLRVVRLRRDLDLASKYNRSRDQIESLMKDGEGSAHEFFEPQSVWTNPKEGVHTAAVDPARTGKEHAGEAAEPGFSFCSMVCPGCVLCNTCPLVTRIAEESFDYGQKHFEA